MSESSDYYFLACKVSPGLFTTERQITINLPDGREVVAFVDERNVRLKPNETLELERPEKSVDGWVKVFPVNVKERTALVDLPQGGFTEGPRIEIPATQLIQP